MRKKQKKKAKRRKKPKLSLRKIAEHHYFGRLGELDADNLAMKQFVVVDAGTIIPRTQAERITKEWVRCRIIH